MAGVNMRLEAGAIRYVIANLLNVELLFNLINSELHWHATAEWGYVLKVEQPLITLPHRI